MGYWTCPRCGSNDVYEGTITVSSTFSKPSIIVSDGEDFAFGPSKSTTSTKDVKAWKCRSCGDQLGEKDYKYTPEEELNRTQSELKRKRRWFVFILWAILVCLVSELYRGYLLENNPFGLDRSEADRFYPIGFSSMQWLFIAAGSFALSYALVRLFEYLMDKIIG